MSIVSVILEKKNIEVIAQNKQNSQERGKLVAGHAPTKSPRASQHYLTEGVLPGHELTFHSGLLKGVCPKSLSA